MILGPLNVLHPALRYLETPLFSHQSIHQQSLVSKRKTPQQKKLVEQMSETIKLTS